MPTPCQASALSLFFMWYVMVKCLETVFTVCVSDITMGCCNGCLWILWGLLVGTPLKCWSVCVCTCTSMYSTSSCMIIVFLLHLSLPLPPSLSHTHIYLINISFCLSFCVLVTLKASNNMNIMIVNTLSLPFLPTT